MLGQQTRETSLPAGGRRGWLYYQGMSINRDAACRPGKTEMTFGAWATCRAERRRAQVGR